LLDDKEASGPVARASDEDWTRETSRNRDESNLRRRVRVKREHGDDRQARDSVVARPRVPDGSRGYHKP
jgi:hypothetical protein